MATARLINPIEMADGSVAYVVEAEPGEVEPFTGPAGRDWANFVVEPEGYARFEWRASEEYYDEEDDSIAREAAECLDLPKWARVRTFPAGGPGTGFNQTLVVLTRCKCLGDLADHLNRSR